MVDFPSAHSRCRAAHRCVECCRSARCAGRGCGSLMLLDANLLLYAVDRTSPPVRVERALTGPAVFLAEQVRLRGASRTAAAAVLPLASLAAIVVAGPVRVLSQMHISRSRHQHSSKDYTPRTSRGYSSDASFGAAWQGHTLALAPRWTRTFVYGTIRVCLNSRTARAIVTSSRWTTQAAHHDAKVSACGRQSHWILMSWLRQRRCDGSGTSG